MTKLGFSMPITVINASETLIKMKICPRVAMFLPYRFWGSHSYWYRQKIQSVLCMKVEAVLTSK